MRQGGYWDAVMNAGSVLERVKQFLHLLPTYQDDNPSCKMNSREQPYPHRKPGRNGYDWRISIYEREKQIANADSESAKYRDVWGLLTAIDLVFDSYSRFNSNNELNHELPNYNSYQSNFMEK